MNHIKNVLERLRIYFKAKNNRELAEKMGINYQTLNTWIKRNKIPYELLHEIGQNENISIDWLLTGKGEMFLNQPKIAGIVNSEIQNAAIAGHNGLAIAGNNINGNNNTITSTLSEEDKMIQELIIAFKKLPKRLQRGYYFKILGDAELYSEDEDNDRN